jgi:ubiquinol-cytochrome c reductase cytochrome b subunit
MNLINLNKFNKKYKYNSLLKKNIILSLVNDYFINSPLPANLNYMWNFGSLLGLLLVLQLITGIILACHYIPNVDSAFSAVEHIMRDVNSGYALRYVHSNGAGFFFIVVYLHITRGLYYGSFFKPREQLWNIGVIIFFLMIATGFLGYTLPWGQMSFWGAVVITNLLSAIPWIGTDLVQLIWGGFAVDNATLNRFFSLHFTLPFILTGLVVAHFLALHEHGSNNPLGISGGSDKINLDPYYTMKDLVGFILFFIIFIIFVSFIPNYLGHTDNYIPANPLVTPSEIVPEFYLLPFYAILRSIPNKLIGVIAMFIAIFILLILPYIPTRNIRAATFKTVYRIELWFFIINFIFLMYLGSKPVTEPYITLGQFACFIYFYFFIICVPIWGLKERILNYDNNISLIKPPVH